MDIDVEAYDDEDSRLEEATMQDEIMEVSEGARSKPFLKACKYLLLHNRVDILANKVYDSLRFKNFVRVEAVGFSGGLWLLWNKEEINLRIIAIHDNFIHAIASLKGEMVHVVHVYAPPNQQGRKKFWDDLESELNGIITPFLLEETSTASSRKGGADILSSDSGRFADWINSLNLINMGATGSRFTWRRGITANTKVHKRLDKIFTNLLGRLRWEKAEVKHLPAIGSDHNPLYLSLTRPNPINHARRNNWDRNSKAYATLDDMKTKLLQWNRDTFVARITGIRDAMERRNNRGLIDLDNKLQAELADTLAQEKTLWFQKICENWIELGDRSTKFFHNSTIIRRRRNKIEAIKVGVDNWITKP
ncbi:hypothetical protein V2J09_022430 [Rumex salicifolius]